MKDILTRKNKNKGKNFTLILTFITAASLLFCISVLCSCSSPKEADQDRNYTISGQLSEAVSSAQNTLSQIKKAYAEGNLVKIRTAQYKVLFKDSVVMGDSIASGLSSYGYLSEDQVFCQVGGSVMNSAEKINAAAAKKPETAFFSYGINDLGMYSGNTEMFIEQYTSLIKDFMKDSPDSKIYVNSLSMPSESKISSGGYFYKWEEYNTAIKQMCEDLDVQFIDNVDILKSRPDLYAGDGLHVNSAYYPIWIERMIKAADL